MEYSQLILEKAKEDINGLFPERNGNDQSKTGTAMNRE